MLPADNTVDREATLERLLAEFMEARDQGRPLDPVDWLERNPDYRPHLEEFLAQDGWFEKRLISIGSREIGSLASHGESIPDGDCLNLVPGYEVLESIGHGGMGIVYRVRQRQPARVVAMKIMRAGRFATVVERQRFLTEAEAVSRLDHPGIVPIYEVGETDGRPYYTMKLIGGGNLSRHLARLKTDPRGGARLIGILARAVHHAHQRGVLHRDLKPGNILLDENDGPYVADFGLAKLEEGVDQTQTGELVGTPSYMSPEQTVGRRGTLTTATDVYGLGAVLYACLTGVAPFTCESVVETMDRVRFQEALSPSHLNPLVSPDLDAICLKCLEKEPSRRYASAEALADDLDRAVEGKHVRARRTGILERQWRWVRRRPALAALFAVAFLALLGGAWLTIRLAITRSEMQASVHLAASQEYYAVVERTRQRRSEQRLGWARESLADLARATQLPPAADRLPELRTEAAACLAAVDFQRVRTLSEDFPVYGLAFSRDGKLALARNTPDGAIGRVRLIDPNDGRILRDLTYSPDLAYMVSHGKTDGARNVAFSPDGRWLVASSRGGWLHRWDLNADTERAVSWQPYLVDGRPHPAVLRFGVTKPCLFTSGPRVPLQCWDMANGWKLLSNLGNRSAPAIDPFTGRIMSTDGHRLRFLTGRTLGTPTDPVDHDHLRLGAMWASPAGRIAAAVNDGSGLRLLDIQYGQVLRSLVVPDGDFADPAGITDVAFSPDGTLVASASEWSRRVKVWDVAGGRLVADFVAGGDGSMRIAFHPKRPELAVAAGFRVEIYEVIRSGVLAVLALQPYSLAAAALSPNGSSLACLSERINQTKGPDRFEVSAWSTRLAPRPKSVGTIEPKTGMKSPVVAVLVDGGIIIPSGDQLELRYDLNEAVDSPLMLEDAKAIAIGPDGRLWAVAGDDVRAYQLPQWEESAKWSNDAFDSRAGQAFYTVAPGAERVLAGRRDGRVIVLDSAAQHLATWTVGRQPVTALALHENSGLAVAGDEDGHLRLFHAPTGDVLTDLSQAHRDAIEAAAIRPDGKLLATGGRDRAIRLWRPDGSPVMTLPATGPVGMLAFSPTGKQLYVLVNGERAVRCWRLGQLAKLMRDSGIKPGF